MIRKGVNAREREKRTSNRYYNINVTYYVMPRMVKGKRDKFIYTLSFFEPTRDRV